MKYDLNIYELGQLINDIGAHYSIEMLSKIKLSGGWMTMTGKVSIVSMPEDKLSLKGNNIITLKVNGNNYGGTLVKITGSKDNNFTIEISPTKYKTFNKGGLNLNNKVKLKEDECKIRIDEDIIFTVRNASVDALTKIVNAILN